MNIVAAIDNWIFVLLVVIVSLLRWLATKANTSKSERDQQPPQRRGPEGTQPRRIPPLSDEEQIRKFLEALGQPRTAKPPAPVPPRTDVAPRPVAPVQPPRSILIPEIRPVKSPPQPPPIIPPAPAEKVPVRIQRRYEVRASSRVEAPTFEVHEVAAPLPEVAPATNLPAAAAGQIPGVVAQPDTGIVGMLRSGRSVRQAIILREILGRPRAFQPLEDLPGTA